MSTVRSTVALAAAVLAGWLVASAAAAAEPVTEPGSSWRVFPHSNAWTGHGAVNIDKGGVTVASLDACRQRCLADKHCSCVVFGMLSKQKQGPPARRCWTRSQCVAAQFESNWAQYNVSVREYPAAAGRRCDAARGAATNLDTNATAAPNSTEWQCMQVRFHHRHQVAHRAGPIVLTTHSDLRSAARPTANATVRCSCRPGSITLGDHARSLPACRPLITRDVISSP